MNGSMPLVAALLLVAPFSFQSTVTAQPSSAEGGEPLDRVLVGPGESVELRREEAVLWRFAHGADLTKPYFHPLALAGGRPLTRNRPADHVWHHGLWFSWKYIDGVNYWEHDRATGRPVGRTEWSNVEVLPRDDRSVRITMDLEYRPGDDAHPVLAEERVIEVSPPDGAGAFHIDWQSTFEAKAEAVRLDRTPLPGEPGGQVYGGYAGLSLRLIDLDERVATTLEGTASFNEQHRLRTRSSAMDYSGLIEGEPAGIAVLDHPQNLNAPTPWYAIRSGSMTFFTPAVICYGAHDLKRGEKFSLRYRILVHPGRWDAARLAKEHERFVEAGEPKDIR